MADNDSTAAATAAAGTPATGEGTTEGTATTPATGAAGAPATGAASAGSAAEPALTPEQITEIVRSNERMQAALKTANGEAEKLRKAEKARNDAALSEEEQARQAKVEFEAEKEAFLVERAELRVSQQVVGLTAKLKLVDAELVTRLIDWDDLEFDDAGVPQNVEDVVKKIIAARPILVGTTTTTGQQTGNDAAAGTGGGGQGPNLTAEELAAAQQAGITPERFASLKSVRTLDEWKATRRTGQGT